MLGVYMWSLSGVSEHVVLVNQAVTIMDHLSEILNK